MSKIHGCFFSALLVGCFFIAASSAETIVLNSGKIVEGSIIESADKYVKVDVGGVALSYYFEDIATINGKTVNAFLSEKNTASTSLQKTISSIASQTSAQWANWYATVSDYMNKMQTLSIKGNLIFRQMRKALEEARLHKDAESLKSIAQQTRDDIQVLLKMIQEIQPPEELKDYHAKQIEIIQYINSFAQVFPTEDTGVTLSTMRKITAAMIGACADLKRVYLKHQAPKEFIDQLDMLVVQLNAGLEKLPKEEKPTQPTQSAQPTP